MAKIIQYFYFLQKAGAATNVFCYLLDWNYSLLVVTITGAITGVKVCHRHTDGQANSLTPYTGICGFFLSVKFATSLLALLPGDYQWAFTHAGGYGNNLCHHYF